MKNISKKNVFLYLSVILSAVNIFLLSDTINKKKEMTELKMQVQDLEGEQQEKGKTDVDVAELEKQEVSKQWEALAYGKYIRLAQKEEADRSLIASRLWEESGIEGVKEAKLKAVCPMQIAGADGEMYLFHYLTDNANGISSGNYCVIWIDWQTNRSETLFGTEGSHTLTSLHEFYDVQVCDADGNGEDDIILLLGAHRSTGAGYYLPDLYCMVALQNNGKFQCVSQETEEWLEEVLYPLYSEQNESRKIANIIGEITAHYGKEGIETAVEEGATLEDFIGINDEKLLNKLDERSLFFERELLWETYELDENNHIQGIKVYKEKGENGMPRTQAAVYLFDYTAEEVEKLEVPKVYQEITDQGESIKDVELEEVVVKEIDGVRNICMKVEIVLATKHLPYELYIK